MTREEFDRRKRAIDNAVRRGDTNEEQRRIAMENLLDEWQRDGED